MLNTICKYLNLSNDSDLILPNLYIGNRESSQNVSFLKNNNIKLIVNCSKNIKFVELDDIEKIRIPIDDNRIFKNYDILKYLECLEIIEKYRKENKNILIHCFMGSQRSATIILFFLINKLGYTYEQGFNLIKFKRPICFCPFNNFSHVFDNNTFTFS
jgi:protein-tyrosine phosphatase